jgi:PAS domain-containing protein
MYDAETLRILAMNGAAMRKYGYAREELQGLTLADDLLRATTKWFETA